MALGRIGQSRSSAETSGSPRATCSARPVLTAVGGGAQPTAYSADLRRAAAFALHARFRIQMMFFSSSIVLQPMHLELRIFVWLGRLLVPVSAHRSPFIQIGRRWSCGARNVSFDES